MGSTAGELGGDSPETVRVFQARSNEEEPNWDDRVGSESRGESQGLGGRWVKYHRATYAGSGLAVRADGAGDASRSTEEHQVHRSSQM